MNTRFLFLLIVLLIAAQDSPPLAITSPAADEALRGEVNITGSVNIPNFTVAQLEFAYVSNPTNTWFNIRTFSEPVVDSTLAVWDTRTITDGGYLLRVRATLDDGTSQEVTVPVAVLNDVAEITPTAVPPTPTPEIAVQIPTPFLLAASPTPTEVPRPTPTALPSNPASLGKNEIYGSLGWGGLVMIGLFALGGLMIRLRRF
ncbi:MAG TPA: hypothetical protein VJ821_16535 [Anaerolineales bacterium]|nr:hypothetical protein [Anaerolineales bacterium]